MRPRVDTLRVANRVQKTPRGAASCTSQGFRAISVPAKGNHRGFRSVPYQPEVIILGFEQLSYQQAVITEDF